MKFVRLYTGHDGQSHFEELDKNEGRVFFSKTHPATAVVFKNDPTDHLVDWHPAPRRQFCITLAGSIEILVGDGTTMTFGPGDVFLADDLTGQGHKVLTRKNWVRAFVHIP